MLHDPTTGAQIVEIGSALAGGVPTIANNPATVKTGQVVIAVTGTAVQLGSATLVNGLVIKAKSTNGAPGTVGDSTVTNDVTGAGNGYICDPGEAASFAVTNANKVWVNGTAGDIWSWEGN